MRAIRGGDHGKIEFVECFDCIGNDAFRRASQVKTTQYAVDWYVGEAIACMFDQTGVRAGGEDKQALVRQADGDEPLIHQEIIGVHSPVASSLCWPGMSP